MPTNLYVHLRDGSDVLINDVTATPTLDDKDVQSQPYRDLGHRGGSPTLDIVEIRNSDPDRRLNFAPSVKPGIVVGTGNTQGLVASAPDNVTHVPPRQTPLKITCYVFATSSGIDHWIPFEDVITWSQNPRT